MNFHQDQNKWKHNLLPIEIGKNEQDRVIDLLMYKNHYVLIKNLHVVLRNHNKNFICGRCLNLYTSEQMFLTHKPKGENYERFTIRISSESHLHWKCHFRKKPKFSRIGADFEADNEIDISSIGNKTTNI